MNMMTGSNLNKVELDFGPLLEGRFLTRTNRFRAEVRIADKEVSAHLANPGRLEELLVQNQTVWLKHAPHPRRKTQYDLAVVDHNATLVSLNAHLPNALLSKALRSGRLPWVDPEAAVRPEARLGDSRLDFHLTSQDKRECWLEAKSVTLVREQRALFPDAPTRRGCRHLRELIAAVHRGDQALVVFVIQRNDAEMFAPNDTTDPSFCLTLRAAAEAGVQIRAIRCQVTLECIGLDSEIPVSLDGAIRYSYNLNQSLS